MKHHWNAKKGHNSRFQTQYLKKWNFLDNHEEIRCPMLGL